MKIRFVSRIIFGFYFSRAVDETGRRNYPAANNLLENIYISSNNDQIIEQTPAAWDMLYSLVCLRIGYQERSLDLLNNAANKLIHRSRDLNESNYLLAYADTIFEGIAATHHVDIETPPDWSLMSRRYDLSQVRFNVRSTFPIKRDLS